MAEDANSAGDAEVVIGTACSLHALQEPLDEEALLEKKRRRELDHQKYPDEAQSGGGLCV